MIKEELPKSLSDSELADDSLDKVAGGKLGSGEKLIDSEGQHWTVYDTGDLYPCPKCGSTEVENWDPGPYKKMWVKCFHCQYWGERGSGWKGYV